MKFTTQSNVEEKTLTAYVSQSSDACTEYLVIDAGDGRAVIFSEYGMGVDGVFNPNSPRIVKRFYEGDKFTITL